MATAASQPRLKGLDLGTSRIVLATLSGEKAKFTPQLNAFTEIPYAKMTEKMLSNEGILHEIEGSRIYAYGNRADRAADLMSLAGSNTEPTPEPAANEHRDQERPESGFTLDSPR